ncbi:apurinic/apyrimidinic endonuclease, putative [Bodo saltans]|uniref:DNA-(apurinic or apyrimidinic site) endonuclease n=1 Tax=Bodo saltans TaxID=75058 RepID=A0A0S4JDZ9_BODSA|nr:apurinic/apyrimidinic endonuclease, putative [Bodo saltans]|eukprot:CUG88396.1 apurinic/apyrimidinic endonuclease, putative [Bodo saltans]
MSPKKQPRSTDDDSATPVVEPRSKAARKETPPAAAEKLASRKVSNTSAAVTEEQILASTVPFVRTTKDKDHNSKTTLKIIAWNVAGLRALLKKDGNPLQTLIDTQQPDILCLQETKLSDPIEAAKTGVIAGYTFTDSISTAKKGYSGTRTYVKDNMNYNVSHVAGFRVLATETPKEDEEGRVLTTIIDKDGSKIALVNSYVPNSGMTLDRLDYRTETYDPMVRKLLADLHTRVGAGGSVIWTGDLNVAERDYDRYFATNFKAMQKVPGFTPEERASFRRTLAETNMVDSFRHLYPNAAGAYSFWSAKFNSKAKGNGWRLDYFVVSQALADRVVDSFMLPDVAGSDHCPIVLWLKK